MVATGEHGGQTFAGPKALMFAVLEEAIRSYFSRKLRVREEAERWINATKARTLFSYAVVCETLDVDPSELLNKLRQLRSQGEIRGRETRQPLQRRHLSSARSPVIARPVD